VATLPKEQVAGLVDAARTLVEAGEDMTFSTGALISFTRGLAELKAAIERPIRSQAQLATLVAAAHRVIDGASHDALIKARRGSSFVGHLRALRYALRELDT
jgi:hypothetical protein